MARVHVIGAGLAGLSAAVRIARRGLSVCLYEAAPQAGGRCRSYDDSELGARIDNGNHLIVAGNDAVMAYIAEIGAASTFHASERATFAFFDINSGERWLVWPNDGVAPFWLFNRARRVPGIDIRAYGEALKLNSAAENATVAEILDPRSLIYRRLWRPLCVAALNTEPEAASAKLFWRVLADTFGRGGAAMRPILPIGDLSRSLIDPALQALRDHGAEIRFGARLRIIEFDDTKVRALAFGDQTLALAEDDLVILATSPAAAKDLVAGLVCPEDYRAIVNVHYAIEARDAPALRENSFLGLIGGKVDWVFAKPGIVSTTTSAATDLVEQPAEELAPQLWGEVALALEFADKPLPRWRVVKEKRATFAATPAQLRSRPPTTTPWSNLLLAGDWTDTGWPATIEGAVRSGLAAASAAIARLARG